MSRLPLSLRLAPPIRPVVLRSVSVGLAGLRKLISEMATLFDDAAATVVPLMETENTPS